jgi:hypothetical protein
VTTTETSIGTTTDRKIAFATVVVSSLNILAVQLFGLLGIVINLMAYSVVNGGLPERPAGQDSTYIGDWIGLAVWPLPWWSIALSGVVMLAVVIVSRRRERRFDPPLTRNSAVYRTTPLFLCVASLYNGLVVFGVSVFYDGLYSVASLYWIGPLLYLVAAVVAFRVWQLDQPASTTKKKSVAPSRVARTAVVVSSINFALLTVVGVGALVASQVGYLAANAGQLAREPVRGEYGFDVWYGNLAIVPPAAFFFASNLIALAVFVVSLNRRNRYAAVGDRSRFLVKTTPGFLAALGYVSATIQWGLMPYFYGNADAFAVFAGPIFALLIAIAATAVAYLEPSTPKRPQSALRPVRKKKAA